MNGLSKHIIIVLLCALGLSLQAQNVFQPKPIEYNLKGVVYATETMFEIRPHLQGFTVAYKKGKLDSYYKTSYMSYEIGYMKDAQEKRQQITGERIGDASRNPFIYGKQSQLFNLRVAYGQKNYLSEKTRRKGVAVGWIYEIGGSLGLIKPYYVNVIRTSDDLVDRQIEAIRYSEENHEDFLDFDRIYGGTNFWKGFTEISPTIGLHTKVGLHLGLGAFEDKAKAVEVGVMMDVYPREIPLMVERNDVSNSFFLAKLYASFQFGSRKL